MKRRLLLAAGLLAGTGTIAGCASKLYGASSSKYEIDSISQMVPPAGAFDSSLTRDDSINDNFEAGFSNPDGSVSVLIGIDVYEATTDAERRYVAAEAGFRDPQEMTFTEEAFWDTQHGRIAFAAFRDSNAVGQAAAAHESSGAPVPDQARAQAAARGMYNHWQSL